MSATEITVDESAPLELRVLATALRAKMSGVLSEGVDSGERLVAVDSPEEYAVRIRSGPDSWEIRSRPGAFVVAGQGGERSIRWFLPLSPPIAVGKTGSLRVGISGGDDDRRLRMTWKTLAELRRRSIDHVAIVIGSCDLPTAADQRPHEVHEDPDSFELMMILSRLDVVLECTDGFDTESYLAVAARDAGVPVVAHEDRSDLTRAGNAPAERWSADGFVDALQRARDRTDSIAPAGPLEEILELISER